MDAVTHYLHYEYLEAEPASVVLLLLEDHPCDNDFAVPLLELTLGPVVDADLFDELLHLW